MIPTYTFRNHRTQEQSSLSILEFSKTHRLTEEQVKKLIGGKSVHCWVWNKQLTPKRRRRS